jgi:hypothetical protein
MSDTRFTLPLRPLLGLASLATAAVAVWLFMVITLVLPARDPGHIATWRMVALAFLAYSALCGACLFGGPRVAWLRWAVLPLSLFAMGLGAYGFVSELRLAGSGGHFEGYILLMGLILFGHGASGVLYTLRVLGIRRKLATG